MVKFSQVFLKDLFARRKIAEAVLSMADFSKKENALLEIGPGYGALTSLVFGKVQSFKVVEIDRKYALALSLKYPAISVINEDFLKTDIDSIFPDSGNVYFFGNLPYKISTAIMEKILDVKKFCGAIFMFQKEVVERLTAKAGDKTYGYFSAICALETQIKEILFVPRRCFFPVPKVDSAVVEIKPVAEKFDASFIKNYRKAVSLSFAHRRKTVENSIYISLKGALSRDEIRKMLILSGINPKVRAENLVVEDFKNMAHFLSIATKDNFI